MKTTKKKYKTPEIEKVVIDTDISLALESEPPYGPDEGSVYEDSSDNKNLISTSSLI